VLLLGGVQLGALRAGTPRDPPRGRASALLPSCRGWEPVNLERRVPAPASHDVTRASPSSIPTAPRTIGSTSPVGCCIRRCGGQCSYSSILGCGTVIRVVRCGRGPASGMACGCERTGWLGRRQLGLSRPAVSQARPSPVIGASRGGDSTRSTLYQHLAKRRHLASHPLGRERAAGVPPCCTPTWSR
jgi:hypothetical protein